MGRYKKRLATSASTTDHEISFKSDDPNTFARYDKPDINQPGINESNMTAPPFEEDKEVVLKQLKSLNTRKGAGPGGLNPQIMCLPTGAYHYEDVQEFHTATYYTETMEIRCNHTFFT